MTPPLGSGEAVDTVIVGAGLAGCAAALRLAEAGGRPLLLERTEQPQPRICGQFVSGEAARLLHALGVDVQVLGGQPTERVRLWRGEHCREAALPLRSYGLSRRALDGALQQACERAGVDLRRGHRVSALQQSPYSHRVRLQLQPREGPAVQLLARSVFLAVGKTDLPGSARVPLKPPDALVGLQAHLRLAPAQHCQLEGHVEVMWFEGGYAGLQTVEHGWTNLCLLTDRRDAAAGGAGGPARWLSDAVAACPALTRRLAGAHWADAPVQTIFRVPYGHLHRPEVSPVADGPGGYEPGEPCRMAAVWRLGDQAAVIPSFTGDGMAIALHSGLLAASLHRQGRDADDYHRRLAREVGPAVRLAHGLYRLGRHRLAGPVLQGLLQRWPQLIRQVAVRTRLPALAVERVLGHR